MLEEKDFTVNVDGSVDLPIGDKTVRFTKESDLLAVRGAKEKLKKDWETEKAQFNTQLAEANRLRDEASQQLLQAQAAKEQLAEQFQDYDTHKARVGELELELGSHKERLSQHEKELAERISQGLITLGVAEDKLKEKTLDQLRSLEEAAKLIGGTKPANYDGGKGGSNAPETPLDRARRILEEHENAGHRIGARVKVG